MPMNLSACETDDPKNVMTRRSTAPTCSDRQSLERRWSENSRCNTSEAGCTCCFGPSRGELGNCVEQLGGGGALMLQHTANGSQLASEMRVENVSMPGQGPFDAGPWPLVTSPLLGPDGRAAVNYALQPDRVRLGWTRTTASSDFPI